MALHSELVIVSSGRIQRHNVPKDCCAQKTCDKKSTCWVEMKVNGMSLHVQLCSDHAEEFGSRHLGTYKGLL